MRIWIIGKGNADLTMRWERTMEMQSSEQSQSMNNGNWMGKTCHNAFPIAFQQQTQWFFPWLTLQEWAAVCSEGLLDHNFLVIAMPRSAISLTNCFCCWWNLSGCVTSPIFCPSPAFIKHLFVAFKRLALRLICCFQNDCCEIHMALACCHHNAETTLLCVESRQLLWLSKKTDS